MSVPNSIRDREYKKFREDANGDTAVNTVVSGGEISGTLNPSGLMNGGRISEVTINSTTWTALPVTALEDRNALAIQNPSGNPDVKINYDDTESGYIGMVIVGGGERFYDITDSIIIYAKSASGTPTLNIEEIS